MLYFPKDGNEETSSLSCVLTIIHQLEWELHIVFRDEETANESYLKPLYFHSSFFFVCTRDAVQCLCSVHWAQNLRQHLWLSVWNHCVICCVRVIWLYVTFTTPFCLVMIATLAIKNLNLGVFGVFFKKKTTFKLCSKMLMLFILFKI